MTTLKKVTLSVNGVEREFEGVNLKVDDREGEVTVHKDILDSIESFGYEFGGLTGARVDVDFVVRGSVSFDLTEDELTEYSDEEEVQTAIELGDLGDYQLERALDDALSDIGVGDLDEYDISVYADE